MDKKRGGSHDNEKDMTYKKGTTTGRLDYALLSPSAAENLTSIKNLQEFYLEGLSDHSAILIDIKLE